MGRVEHWPLAGYLTQSLASIPRVGAASCEHDCMSSRKPIWKGEPDDHDFPAAAQYLSLLTGKDHVKSLIEKLHEAEPTTHKAKDILRAAVLPLLGAENPHVAGDLAKIEAGTPLSPVLLVRGDLDEGRPLQIADGYHRVCASFHTDENTIIPCLLAGPELPK